MNKKRGIHYLLTLILLGAVLIAGCSGGGTNGNGNEAVSEGNKPTASEEPVKDKEPETLRMMVVNHPVWPFNENWPVYQNIKEATGISFDAEGVPGADYENALNLTIASGDLPDLLFLNNPQQANRFGAQGAFVDVTEHLDKMPNYKAFLEAHPDIKQSVTSADGKNYIMPNYGLGEQFRRVWLYREDVFEKHGLNVPTNYDELYDVALELKTLYPESYPLNFFDNLTTVTNIAPNFGTSAYNGTSELAYFDHGSKQWKYGPIEDNFKSMLEYLSKFYQAGLIPPDFMSLQRNQSRDLFAQDKGFLSADFIGIIDEYKAAIPDKPEFQLAYMPPIAGGPNGKKQNPFTAFQTSGFAIASTTEKLDAVIRYMDFMYSQEGIELVSWGKEGESFQIVNEKKEFKTDFKDFGDLRIQTGMVTNGSYAAMDFDAYLALASDTLNDAFGLVEQYEAIPQPRPAMTEEELQVLATVGQGIQKHYQENIARFIIGTRSLSEWDQYVKEANDLGVPQVVEVFKNAHDRALTMQ